MKPHRTHPLPMGLYTKLNNARGGHAGLTIGSTYQTTGALV